MDGSSVLTAIVSDLHLGSTVGVDILRRPAVRERLIAALKGVDQLVLLGDVLELREASRTRAMDSAMPVLAELGEALDGGRVVLVPGNHDHRLAGPLLRQARPPLELEQTMAPAPSDPLGPLAARLGATELVLAYPGVWLRPDVYATHGHYMDYHGSIPTFECLAIGVAKKLVREQEEEPSRPDDYEAVLAPVYSTIDRLVDRSTAVSRAEAVGGSPILRLWERITSGEGDGARRAAERLAATALPGTLAAVNRAGLGSFSADLSTAELQRAGLRSTRAFSERLGIQAAHLVFGHTHRAGPWPDDDPGDWRAPRRTSLTNTGSWAYQPALLGPTPGQSRWWPGTVAFLEDEGPPRLESLLHDVPHEELRAIA